MKASQIVERMAVRKKDSLINLGGGHILKQGIIVSAEIKREGTLIKVLVLFEDEVNPRYVPVSRLSEIKAL